MKKVIDFPDGSTIEQQAAEWLVRLDGDQVLSPEERLSLRRWMARSPVHREQIFRLAELWSDMNVLSELAVTLDQVAQVESGRQRWLRRAPIIAVAASIVGAMGIAILIGGGSALDSNGLYATAVGQHRFIELSDGSTVNLNTDSQIRVDYGGEYRDVILLRGEAHFSVAEDRGIPFRVSAGRGRIRALGTAFSVYIRNGSVDVTVSEGHVVLERVVASGAPLEFGAGARVQTAEGSVRELGTLRAGQVATIPSLVDAPDQTVNLRNFGNIEPPEMQRRLSWTEGVLHFSGVALDEVVREIGRYTMAEIEFADPEVGAIRIGGRFPVGETETMFETLENSFGLSVTYTSEDHVLISAGD